MQHRSWQRLLRNFLPIALILVTLGSFVYVSEADDVLEELIEKEQDHLNAAKLAVYRDLLNLSRETLFLANSSSIAQFIARPGAAAHENAEQELLAFIKAKPDYFKARWIDETGQERVRVERLESGVVIQPAARSEQKTDRYHFIETMKLKQGEFFLSPIDSNVDHNISTLTPTLRAATTVFGRTGKPRGIVVVSYSVAELYNSIQSISISAHDDWMMLDQGGYWLRSPVAADEFGRTLPHHPGMASRNPLTWAQINSAPSGHFIDEHGDLWLHETLYPYQALNHGSLPQAEAFDANSMRWKLVKHIKAARLSDMLESLRLQSATLLGLTLALALLFSMRLTRTQLSREAHEAALKLALDELKYKEQRLNEAQLLGHIGSWELDLRQHVMSWSDEMYLLFELDRAKVPPSYEACIEIVHPDDRALVERTFNDSLASRESYHIEYRLLLADGRIKWVSETGLTHFDSDGIPLESVGTLQDISSRKSDDEKLRIASIAFETQEAIIVTDASANIISVNHAFERLTGYSSAEVVGKNPRILKSGRHDAAFYQHMWKSLHETGSWSGEMWDKRKDGSLYPKLLNVTSVRNEANEVSHYVAIFMDISERKRAEEEIHRLAFYDTLTELPNRRLLMDRLGQALAFSHRSATHGALLFMDLDNFKSLNDTKGHDVGDMLLIEAALRIKACVRESDTVARLGGDEFVVILQELGSSPTLAANQAEHLAKKIVATLSTPYHLAGYEHHSSASIGVCLFHERDTTVDDLLRRADTAMYQAKAAGRNTVRFFESAMQTAVELRAVLGAELRHAIAHQELQVYFQMQVDGDQRVIGAEALLRWFNPERGFVPPLQFIPLAEESGLILQIGDWVLETACAQLKQWELVEATRNLQLAVNVSARQFHQHDMVENIAALIERFSINPALLKLELTESLVLADVEETIQKMCALKKLGLQLSLDDFGTGYSSLSYLKRLPLDQIKIDQSFVRDIVTDNGDAIIIKSIIDMSRNFGLDVIAEGVETEAQLDILKLHGCTSFQGYYFGKAMPLSEFEQMVIRSSPVLAK